MRRFPVWFLVVLAASLVVGGATALGQSGGGGGAIVFTTRRPPRELLGNIRGWATSNIARTYAEDVSTHVWRLQFMAFLSRAPRSAEVTLVFYHLERNGTRRYVSNQPISLTDPNERVFFHQTVLHRSPDEFQPMENYEAAITVADSRGSTEIARGRIGLTGQVERHDGVVDFTSGAGVVH